MQFPIFVCIICLQFTTADDIFIIIVFKRCHSHRRPHTHTHVLHVRSKTAPPTRLHLYSNPISIGICSRPCVVGGHCIPSNFCSLSIFYRILLLRLKRQHSDYEITSSITISSWAHNTHRAKRDTSGICPPKRYATNTREHARVTVYFENIIY